jgi:tripartite-type tricarboxylate transporter receptor subunit TctC
MKVYQKVISIVAGFWFCLGLCTTAIAAVLSTLPDKTIQYIIPFHLPVSLNWWLGTKQKSLRRNLGSLWSIINRAGAGGALVWSALNTYPADGSTVVGINIPHTLLQPLQEGIQYKTDDINAIYYYHFTPDALMVSADSPYKTYQEFIAAARKRA